MANVDNITGATDTAAAAEGTLAQQIDAAVAAAAQNIAGMQAAAEEGWTPSTPSAPQDGTNAAAAANT